MEFMCVTALTFQFEISELKLDAPANMYSMFVAALTSQFEMSELKVDFSWKIYPKSVTFDTSQVPISPYVVRVEQEGVVAQFWLI